MREVDRVPVDAKTPGIEPREVEQLAGELRQAVDLLPHPAQELESRRIVEVLVHEQLEMPAEREERRSKLVRRVGDELAARMLEPGQAQAHAVERAGELAQLVRARVLDRLVEPPARDPFCRPLEVADAAREERAPPSRAAERRRVRSAPRSGPAS